eukprot:TRINITY_DN36450_c0_g1_i2.p1 TRINITY_DN36450_c0_g1~~TRINITY_DN36450_c0_g1_i2.p1  ORF type:complete len:307 (-),score=46.60 TRINITY_DN36450_c0_g1_i2:386-1306(-)
MASMVKRIFSRQPATLCTWLCESPLQLLQTGKVQVKEASCWTAALGVALIAPAAGVAYWFATKRQHADARRVFIVRHGLKEDGYAEKLNFTVKLHTEADQGIDQVRRFFIERGQSFGKVLCSPFLRCRKTAEALLPNAEIIIEPGLSECMVHWAGLKGQLGETPAAQVANLILQIDPLLNSQTHKPLLQVSELSPEDDFGCSRLARVAWELKSRRDIFAHGPLVLVTHGSPAFALVEALLDSSNSIIPVFDRKRMPEMGSITELAEQPNGTWRVVGNACPFQHTSGVWDCKWTSGAAAEGADCTKL